MEINMADIKPTVLSAMTILLIVIVTVPVSKWLLNKFPVPGLTDLVNAV